MRQADPAEAKPQREFEGLPSLVQAVQEFQAQAGDLDQTTQAVTRRDGVDRDRLAALNDAISRVERAFLLDDGLPGRPWFKHAIYAPGLTTGYAAWPLPAIRQALEDNNPADWPPPSRNRQPDQEGGEPSRPPRIGRGALWKPLNSETQGLPDH